MMDLLTQQQSLQSNTSHWIYHLIIEKLSPIVDEVNNEDLDTNVKLWEWLENKFLGKVNQKIANEIILGQVELGKKLDKVKIVQGNIISLYRKLCDFSRFTQEITPKVLNLERKHKLPSIQLPSNLANSEKHFSQMLHTQRELAALSAESLQLEKSKCRYKPPLPHTQRYYTRSKCMLKKS